MNSKAATRALDRARWRKSRHSQGNSTCVEVATAAGWVGVRDSKLGAASPILAFTHAEWAALIAALKHGEHNR